MWGENRKRENKEQNSGQKTTPRKISEMYMYLTPRHGCPNIGGLERRQLFLHVGYSIDPRSHYHISISNNMKHPF